MNLPEAEKNIRIPIAVGVTGHRDIDTLQTDLISGIIAAELEELKKKYSESEIIMLNSLAEGADLICAEAAIKLGIKMYAILPFDVEEYRTDFSSDWLERFDNALTKAESVRITGSLLSDNSNRDECYRNAGIFAAEHSHILFALWDGKKGTPEGCGTSDIVYYVQHNMSDYLIKQICVDRKSADSGKMVLPSLKNIGTEGDDGGFCINDILEKTNSFNGENHNPAQGPGTDIKSVYDKADELSIQYQKKYMSAIKLLAATGVAMVLAFLFYDELDLRICLPVYALLLAEGTAVLASGRKRRIHEKYMNYRMLAECMRVQQVLSDTGIDCNAASFYPWTQNRDTLWIKKSVDSLTALEYKPEPAPGSLWIDEQLAYHERSLIKTENKYRANRRISWVITSLTVILVVIALFIELFGESLTDYEILRPQLKFVFLVLIGVLSASSLLLSLYYGKMNLDRKLSDHRNMIRLYKWGKQEIEENGLNENIIKHMVREEIMENGNWYSYTKENGLDINL